MAVPDAYSPCPCGSGQKYKWCCQKVEAQADRAQRLFETGQTQTALDSLDQSLRKDQGNAWLLMLKAVYHARLGQTADAAKDLDTLLAKNPNHPAALGMMVSLTLEIQGVESAVTQLQRALKATPRDRRIELESNFRNIGGYLTVQGDVPAAIRHLRLGLQLGGEDPDPKINGLLRSIERNPEISPWLKNPDQLSPAPPLLKGEPLKVFEDALQLAEEGLWSDAASLFSTLSNDPVCGPIADRNQGFARLWLAHDAAAATSLRRYAATLEPSTEAVDIEALCQLIVPPSGAGVVESIRMTWPVRDRAFLIKALQADPSIYADLDESEPNEAEREAAAPQASRFAILDRPWYTKPTADLRVDDICLVLGRLSVDRDTVSLETLDDKNLDALVDRFVTIAGRGIPPAHPKTKVIERLSLADLALTWDCVLPGDMDLATSKRLTSERWQRSLKELWPNIKMSFLHDRTPIQAAKAGDSVVPLRAALCLLESTPEEFHGGFDFRSFRESLGIEPEPIPDPSTVDTQTLHLSRLGLVSIEGLSDSNLGVLYARSRSARLPIAHERSLRALLAIPPSIRDKNWDPLSLYSDLSTIEASKGNRDAALQILEQGRAEQSPEQQANDALAWDMISLRLRARFDEPSEWVPELSAIMTRYSDDPETAEFLTYHLIDMGLVDVVPNPDRSGTMLLDPRKLRAVFATFGPRVTTPSGNLGISATKPEIWTPGSHLGGGKPEPSKAIWTPGSASKSGPGQPPKTPGGGSSNLIIRGR